MTTTAPTVDVTCPCGRTVEMRTSLAGRQFTCSACGRSLVVSGVPATVPIPAAATTGISPIAVPATASRLRLVPLVLLALASGSAGWVLRGAARPGVGTDVEARAVAPAELARDAPAKPAPPGRREPSAEDPGAGRRDVLAYLKRYANDPASVEVIDWAGPIPAPAGVNWTERIRSDTIVFANYRSRNQFGALTVSQQIFYLKGHQVVDVGDAASMGYLLFRQRMTEYFGATAY